jgi:hypothetical protein
MKLPTKNFKRLLPYIGEPMDGCSPHEMEIVRILDVGRVSNDGMEPVWAVKAEYIMRELGSYTLWDHFHFDKVAYDRDVKLKQLLKNM